MGSSSSVGKCPAESFTQPGQQVGDDVIVDTSKGKVKGFRKKEGGPVNFRGVPVAAPGNLSEHVITLLAHICSCSNGQESLRAPTASRPVGRRTRWYLLYLHCPLCNYFPTQFLITSETKYCRHDVR